LPLVGEERAFVTTTINKAIAALAELTPA